MMIPENNLIKDYCVDNKVAISFKSNEQLNMILALFDRPRYDRTYQTGAITFYIERNDQATTIERITSPIFSHWRDLYTIITAEEFFTLALPSKSILEYLK